MVYKFHIKMPWMTYVKESNSLYFKITDAIRFLFTPKG